MALSLPASAVPPGATPPGWLLALGLSAWGLASGRGALAALAITAVVLMPWLGIRRELSPQIQARATYVTVALFWAWVALSFIEHGASGIYRILAGLPALLSVLVVIQWQSASGRLPWRVLAPSLARLEGSPALPAGSGLDLRTALFLACLVSAGADRGVPEAAYLAAINSLAGLWLLAARPGGPLARPGPCLLALLLALALQLLAVRGLEGTFHWLEGQVLALIDPQHRRVDPLRSETRIGSVLRLKGSERIELRVTVPPTWRTPLLMTEAVYDRYRFGTWTASRANLQTVDRAAIDEPWWLSAEHAPAGAALEVVDFMPAETAALAVPMGAAGLASRTLLGIAGNPLGTLQGDGRRGYQRYRVLPGTRTLAAPTDEDRSLPGFVADALAARAQSLGLAGLHADEAVARLHAHFRQHFRYSLDPPPYRTGQALLDFLDRHRSGHCEYFATAGALLLRAAGIPTRYAVGFWLGEWNEALGSHVARASHAHAWTQVWDGTTWREVDFTPADALPAEARRDPLAQRFATFSEWLAFAWHGEVESGEEAAAADAGEEAQWPWLAAVLALTLLLGWLRWRRRAHPVHDPARLVDDELDALMARLSGKPLGPRPGECVSAWLMRVQAVAKLDAGLAQDVNELHARSRYSCSRDSNDGKDGTGLAHDRTGTRLAVHATRLAELLDRAG